MTNRKRLADDIHKLQTKLLDRCTALTEELFKINRIAHDAYVRTGEAEFRDITRISSDAVKSSVAESENQS